MDEGTNSTKTKRGQKRARIVENNQRQEAVEKCDHPHNEEICTFIKHSIHTHCI